MANQKNSVGEVQQAIKQGAITREYKADMEHVVQALNSLRSTEITSYLQYMQHQYMAVSLLSPGMKTEFQAHATQELDHANRLADRVQQLGGVPIYDPKEISSKAANVGVGREPRQGNFPSLTNLDRFAGFLLLLKLADGELVEFAFR